MADFANVEKSLRERGFQVKTFATGAEAADYLDGAVDGKTVGLGGSLTLQELGVYERLSAHNTVYWHWVNGAETGYALLLPRCTLLPPMAWRRQARS